MLDGSPRRSGTARLATFARGGRSSIGSAVLLNASPLLAATATVYCASSDSVGTVITLTVPRYEWTWRLAAPVGPEPTPNSVATARNLPLSLTASALGYQPVGISPFTVPRAASTTATALMPPSAT